MDNEFILTNLTTGKKFRLLIDTEVDVAGSYPIYLYEGTNEEEFYVDGEAHFIESKTIPSLNLYSMSNGVFDLDLVYGKNRFKIECASGCEIDIMYQEKMGLQ